MTKINPPMPESHIFREGHKVKTRPGIDEKTVLNGTVVRFCRESFDFGWALFFFWIWMPAFFFSGASLATDDVSELKSLEFVFSIKNPFEFSDRWPIMTLNHWLLQAHSEGKSGPFIYVFLMCNYFMPLSIRQDASAFPAHIAKYCLSTFIL